MPRPKVGQKGYKGPVHEAVGSFLETIGIKTGKSAPAKRKSLGGTAYKKPVPYTTNKAMEVMKRRGYGATPEGAEETVRNLALPNPADYFKPAAKSAPKKKAKPKAKR